MNCHSCKNSRFLKFVDKVINNDEKYDKIEITKRVKGKLWCKAYEKIVDNYNEEYCENANYFYD